MLVNSQWSYQCTMGKDSLRSACWQWPVRRLLVTWSSVSTMMVVRYGNLGRCTEVLNSSNNFFNLTCGVDFKVITLFFIGTMGACFVSVSELFLFWQCNLVSCLTLDICINYHDIIYAVLPFLLVTYTTCTQSLYYGYILCIHVFFIISHWLLRLLPLSLSLSLFLPFIFSHMHAYVYVCVCAWLCVCVCVRASMCTD